MTSWVLHDGSLEDDVFAQFNYSRPAICGKLEIKLSLSEKGKILIEATEITHSLAETVDLEGIWKLIEGEPGLPDHVRILLTRNKTHFHCVNPKQNTDEYPAKEYRYGPSLAEAVHRYEEKSI